MKPLPPRSKYLKRSPIKRTAIKKRKRSKSERERIYGPKGYVEWIHNQFCIACGEWGYSECAHIQTGGTGRKDDWTRTVPLCGPRPAITTGIFMGCHRFYDEYPVNFQKAYQLDMKTAAALTQKLWEQHNG